MKHLGYLLRWIAGCEPDLPPAISQVDDLEPYCTSERLQDRLHASGPLSPPQLIPIHKIAARYGANL